MTAVLGETISDAQRFALLESSFVDVALVEVPDIAEAPQPTPTNVAPAAGAAIVSSEVQPAAAALPTATKYEAAWALGKHDLGESNEYLLSELRSRREILEAWQRQVRREISRKNARDEHGCRPSLGDLHDMDLWEDLGAIQTKLIKLDADIEQVGLQVAAKRLQASARRNN